MIDASESIEELKKRVIAKMNKAFGVRWPGMDKKVDKNARRRKRWNSSGS